MGWSHRTLSLVSLLFVSCTIAVAQPAAPADVSQQVGLFCGGRSYLHTATLAAILGGSCAWSQQTGATITYPGGEATITPTGAAKCGDRQALLPAPRTFRGGLVYLPSRLLVLCGKEISWVNSESALRCGTQQVQCLPPWDFYAAVPQAVGCPEWDCPTLTVHGESEPPAYAGDRRAPVGSYQAPLFMLGAGAGGGGNCRMGGSCSPGKVDRNGRTHCSRCGQYM